jgi:predicted ribosomally synthesized peptide with SipW-like signal peptide
MTKTRTRKWAITRAVLAGGVVLGVGAAVTLAVWNDSEYAQGTFTAGAFNLEGSTDGTTFSDHNTSGTAAALTFTVNPTDLAPDDIVYAPFAVRLAAGTTDDSTVAFQTPAGTGTLTGLTYSVYETSAFGCSATNLPDGTELITDAAFAATPSATFDLTAGTGGVAGTAQNLCFVVTAGADLTQAQTGTATWQLLATST